jgi:hypothetical protein
MMSREEEVTAASAATRSARNGFIYGDLHLPPPPYPCLRPLELHEVKEEDSVAPDPAKGIHHLTPGMHAKRH